MDKKVYIEGLLSVIIPVYNSEKYIEETINSVLNQTYQNFEIIIVDDCSTDDSCKIIENLNDERIRLIKLDKNSGVAVARNIAIENANGQYIAFLDSDDIWIRNKLQLQIEQMKEGVSFSYTAIGMIDEKNQIIKEHVSIPIECTYKLLQKNTLIATSTVVLDQNYIKDFKMPNMRSGQDYATWMMILREGIVAHGINKPLVFYRKRNSSLSSNKMKSVKQVWTIQRKQEGIKVIKVFLNIISFSIHAFIKHFF